MADPCFSHDFNVLRELDSYLCHFGHWDRIHLAFLPFSSQIKNSLIFSI